MYASKENRSLLKRSLASLILASLFLTFSASAAFLQLPGATHSMGGNANAAFLGYDTLTDTFTATGANGLVRDLGTLTLAIADLTGSFSLSAQIDETGLFSTGSFTWTGGSASLGIAAGTELMSGTLDLFNDIPLVYQFLGSVDSMNAILAAEIGSMESMLWTVASFATCPPFDGTADNFTCDYSGQSTPEAFVVDFAPSAIPEPPVLALFVMGLISMGLAKRQSGKV